VACSSSQAERIAPDFTLKTIDGQPFSLSAQRGHIVLLNFWATWCGPCRHEVPILNEVYERYREQQVQVVGVAVSSTPLAVELWIENLGVDYPILLTSEEDQELIKQYGADQGIPWSALIDPQGRIHKTYQGMPQDPQAFSQDIAALLAMN